MSAATKTSAADEDAVPATDISVALPSTLVAAELLVKAVLELDTLSVERTSAAIAPSATTDAKRISSGSATAEVLASTISLGSASEKAETAGARSDGKVDVDADGNEVDDADAVAMGLDLVAALVARKDEAVLDFVIRRKFILCRDGGCEKGQSPWNDVTMNDQL